MLVYNYDLVWLKIHDHDKVIKGLSYKDVFMVYLITKATSLLLEGQIFQAYLFCELITPDVVISHIEKDTKKWRHLTEETLNSSNIKKNHFPRNFTWKPTGRSVLDMCWHFELTPSHRG